MEDDRLSLQRPWWRNQPWLKMCNLSVEHATKITKAIPKMWWPNAGSAPAFIAKSASMNSVNAWNASRNNRPKIDAKLAPPIAGIDGRHLYFSLTLTWHGILPYLFPQRSTTMAFDHSSLRWFEACSCRPAPRNLLPVLCSYAHFTYIYEVRSWHTSRNHRFRFFMNCDMKIPHWLMIRLWDYKDTLLQSGLNSQERFVVGRKEKWYVFRLK